MTEKKLLCKDLSYIDGTKKKKNIKCLLVELKFPVIQTSHLYFLIHVLITTKEINKSILHQSCFLKSKNSLKVESQRFGGLSYLRILQTDPRKVTSLLSTSVASYIK